MWMQDTLNYVLFTNPISSVAGSYAKTAVSAVANYSGLVPKVEYVMPPVQPLWKLAASSGPWVRLAALSGASAVIIGAVGAHRNLPDNPVKDAREIFNTANNYHFIHAVAMLGLPLCRVPLLAGTFMLSGTFLFCGSLYYSAMTGDPKFNKFTPMGGTCFILGWLAMVF